MNARLTPPAVVKLAKRDMVLKRFKKMIKKPTRTFENNGTACLSIYRHKTKRKLTISRQQEDIPEDKHLVLSYNVRSLKVHVPSLVRASYSIAQVETGAKLQMKR